MMSSSLPDEIIQRFRAVAIERLESVEAAWAQVITKLDDAAASLIHREIHTLKGESRMVGFTDVNLVCHKLEDLLVVAQARGYAVDEDFDLVVNMALRFMVMLIRKKAGSQLSGIDLPGFVKQIDAILKRHEPHHRSRSGSVPPRLRTASATRVPATVRNQLAPVAVDTFLEYATAKGPRRDRLRVAWHTLRDLIGIQRAMISGAQLELSRPSVTALAHELGKQIDLRFEVATAEVTTEILAAIDVAVLHLLRNAIDHGIETPAIRAASGKGATGTIIVRGGIVDSATVSGKIVDSASGSWRIVDGSSANGSSKVSGGSNGDASKAINGDVFVLTIEDDGNGIDRARVISRAIELGLIGDATPVAPEKLVELMCHPGFSTRTETSEVSGRGMGLDAARGGIVDIGGTLTAKTKPGHGTVWTVAIPIPPLTRSGHVIRAPGLRFPVVIDPSWSLLDRPPELPIIVDLGVAFGFSPSTSISTRAFWFTNGMIELGIVCGGRPTLVQVCRLLPTPPTAIAEVISIDAVEGILLRPERIPGVVSATSP